MPTNEERREVARKLHAIDRENFASSYSEEFEIIEKILGIWDDYDKFLWHVVADLIEPSGHERVPGECPLNVRHDNDRIDRERLLAIATVMAADSVRSAKQGSSVSPVYILHAARNIAEACGETFGSIRNRELIGK